MPRQDQLHGMYKPFTENRKKKHLKIKRPQFYTYSTIAMLALFASTLHDISKVKCADIKSSFTYPNCITVGTAFNTIAFSTKSKVFITFLVPRVTVNEKTTD